MSDTAVLLKVSEAGVATLSLNRPTLHNAFDDLMIAQLQTILDIIHNDSQINVVVLTATGTSFSAGADLNWMRRMAAYSYEENIDDALALAKLMQTLKYLRQPTIASVQGAAFGGGVGLVACCDIAIASEVATFCLSEVKIGLMPAVISPFVIAAIGERAARYYCLTAERMSAAKAVQLGLVTQVVKAEQLDACVENVVQKLLGNNASAVIATKALLNRVSKDPYDKQHRQLNAEAIASIRVSAEGQAGLTAFLEKQKRLK